MEENKKKLIDELLELKFNGGADGASSESDDAADLVRCIRRCGGECRCCECGCTCKVDGTNCYYC